MIASLPMYDWPEVRPATDQLWQALSNQFGSEIALQRGDDYTAAWRNPQLLFSQTCGYPFTHEFKGKLGYVATPHYAATGCEGANYSSFIFARQDVALEELRGCVAAVNTPESMSGMLALKLVFGPLAHRGIFFSGVKMTGGHVASLEAVRDGNADVCATDAICVALARRYRPGLLAGLVEIGRSPWVPGLPFVTIAGDIEMLRKGLQAVFADEDLRHQREKLLLSGLSILPISNYNRILELESEIERMGGLKLS